MDECYRIVAVNQRDADPVCAGHRMDHHKETVLLASTPGFRGRGGGLWSLRSSVSNRRG